MFNANGKVIKVIKAGSFCDLFTQKTVIILYKTFNVMNTNTPVKNFMSSKVVVANLKSKLSQIEELFLKFNVHHLPVTYDDKLLGIISTYDIQRYFHEQLEKGTIDRAQLEAEFDVEKVMTHDPKYVSPTTTMPEFVKLLVEEKLQAMPVVENGLIAGIITNNDVVRYVKYVYEKEAKESSFF